MMNLITVLNPYFYFLVCMFTWFTFTFLLSSLTLLLVSLIVDTICCLLLQFLLMSLPGKHCSYILD